MWVMFMALAAATSLPPEPAPTDAVTPATLISWRARKPPTDPPPTHQLRDPATWPTEPTTPASIDPDLFAEAVAYVCRVPRERSFAPQLLETSKSVGVDPFLLTALMVEQSRCDPSHTSRRGLGLFAIPPALYLGEEGPALPVERRALARRALLDGATSIDTAARLLRMWQDLHPSLDSAFPGVPHRDGVAHFFWGDRVRSSGHEDLVLTTRRRLLARYQGSADLPFEPRPGLIVVPPLEGGPRVATSGPGDDRDGGARRHRGLDIVASVGEPVRAIADGVVIFAGVNARGAPRRGPIPPERIGRWARRRLGTGGIYLCIRHGEPDPTSERRGVVSCYMHLESYVVRKDERVAAGQLVGYVGRTGVKVSPPHLHLEVRVDERAMNPLRFLASATVIPPKATLTHVYVRKAMRARLRAARAAARLRSS